MSSVGAIGTPLDLLDAGQPLAAASASADQFKSDDFLFRGTPAVFAPTRESLVIAFPLHRAALVWVEYGETEKLGETANSDLYGIVPHDDQVVKVRLRNLLPGKRYHWRGVARPLEGGKEIHTRIYRSNTLPDVAPAVHFTVWNDTHDHEGTIQALHHSRREEDDFLFWNGDLSNNVEDRALLPELYVSPKKVDLAEGPPILLSRGNHDVRGVWANKMTDYVDFPRGRPFYSFRTGPVAVLVLDTGEDKPDSHFSFGGVAAFEPLIREQAEWLESEIQKPGICDAPYRIVFCHIPLRWIDESPIDYDQGGYDAYSLRGRNAWTGALKRWGAQVVISGHTHESVWMPPTEEFPFGQLIGGGPKMNNATVIRGDADAGNLTLRLESLQTGKTLEKIVLNPV